MGDVKDKLSAQGIEPLGGTPEAVSAIIRNEVAKWAHQRGRYYAGVSADAVSGAGARGSTADAVAST